MSLDDYRSAIEGEVDRMCLRVGAMLLAAREEHPADFRLWVMNELPFGLETARRLMAVAAAFATLPKDVLDLLPRPMSALYALREVPADVLEVAVVAGALSPTTTTAQAEALAQEYAPRPPGRNGRHTKADVAAGVIIDSQPSDLHPMVLRALLRWCDQARS